MLDIINPRQTVLVSSRGKAKIVGQIVEKDNIAPVDWHTPCNIIPFLYGIVLSKESLSFELIRNSKNFVVNFIGFELKEAAILCGRNSGKNIDKFNELNKLNIAVEESIKIDCPKLRDAIGYLECELVQEIDFGQYVLLIGMVVHHEMKHHNTKRLFHLEKNEFTTVK